jgi:hypothetical protein
MYVVVCRLFERRPLDSPSGGPWRLTSPRTAHGRFTRAIIIGCLGLVTAAPARKARHAPLLKGLRRMGCAKSVSPANRAIDGAHSARPEFAHPTGSQTQAASYSSGTMTRSASSNAWLPAQGRGTRFAATRVSQARWRRGGVGMTTDPASGSPQPIRAPLARSADGCRARGTARARDESLPGPLLAMMVRLVDATIER